MLDGDVSFERCLRDLHWALNARLIIAKKLTSDGDLYGGQRAVSVSMLQCMRSI
jgi:hypothetical protein